MTDQPMLPGMEPVRGASSQELHDEKQREFRKNGRSMLYLGLHRRWAEVVAAENRQEILDYDPNSDEDNMPQFASYCPSRSGASFKMHTRWHHATRAAKLHDGAVYKWNNLSATWVRWEVWFNEEYLGR